MKMQQKLETEFVGHIGLLSSQPKASSLGAKVYLAIITLLMCDKYIKGRPNKHS